jgi:hypothetical protein
MSRRRVVEVAATLGLASPDIHPEKAGVAVAPLAVLLDLPDDVTGRSVTNGAVLADESAEG